MDDYKDINGLAQADGELRNAAPAPRPDYLTDYREAELTEPTVPKESPKPLTINSSELHSERIFTEEDMKDDDTPDVTESLAEAISATKQELIDPYIIKRSFARRVMGDIFLDSSRGRNQLDITFFAKNAGFFLGLLFGLAVARFMHGGIGLYGFMSVVFSQGLGTAKSYFVDKYPLKQSIGMNIVLALGLIIVYILFAIVAAND